MIWVPYEGCKGKVILKYLRNWYIWIHHQYNCTFYWCSISWLFEIFLSHKILGQILWMQRLMSLNLWFVYLIFNLLVFATFKIHLWYIKGTLYLGYVVNYGYIKISIRDIYDPVSEYSNIKHVLDTTPSKYCRFIEKARLWSIGQLPTNLCRISTGCK